MVQTAPVPTKKRCVCPRCGNDTVQRIKRGALMKTFLPFLDLKKYSCMKCFKRFYVKA